MIRAGSSVLPGPLQLVAFSLAASIVGIVPLAGLAQSAASPLAGLSEHVRSRVNLTGAEGQLRRVLESIGEGRSSSALREVDELVSRYPNFRLGHLIHGDLLLARARPITEFGNTGHGERLDGLRAEALARLRAYKEHPAADRIPRYLLRFEPSQKHALVIDASRSRVYVYENADGVPRLVENYYATFGRRGIYKSQEGDQKTPIGVYRVTSKIPGNKLPGIYGWGAFPIDYPNEWDRRLERTGFGIWLHGVPSDTYARPPLASDGCIALANPDLEELDRYLQPGGTPVVISERVEWVTREAWSAEREQFMRQFVAWREDWESLDTGRYLEHYARNFRSNGMDLVAWSAHKRRVNAAKRWVKLSISNVSVFRSPGTQGPMSVTFDQDYRSDNLAQKIRKRQYWIFEGGRWKIAYEAPLGRAAFALPESFPQRSRRTPAASPRS